MRKITVTIWIAALILLASVCTAAQVKVSWTPNDEPDLAGYRLYHGNESRNYTEDYLEIGKDAVSTFVTVPDGFHYWGLTAVDASGNESGYSQEAYLEIDSSAPSPPEGFKVRIVGTFVGEVEIKSITVEGK